MKKNYCTVSVTVCPETGNCRQPKATFACDKGLNLVCGCRYYRPMRAKDGTVCPGECQHFDGSCRSASARADARKRAKRILAAWASS